MLNITQKIFMSKHWSSLVGTSGMYEGADPAELCFKFDGIIWKVLPDDMDGYRSCLEYIIYSKLSSFITCPDLATVTLKKCQNEIFEGYILEDVKDRHIWLRFGTSYVDDDSYPCLVFHHVPRLS